MLRARALPLLVALAASSSSPAAALNATAYAALRASVAATFNLSASYGLLCIACEQGHVIGSIVRLAFHDAAGVNRPNGCVDYTTRDNSNLQTTQLLLDAARAASPFGALVSKADFYVLAATLAIELASTLAATPYVALSTAANNPLNFSVTPLVLPFVSGRVDDSSCVGDNATLPPTSFLWPDITALFSGRFGMTANEIVAIMGAHSLGRINAAPGVLGNISSISWHQSSTSFSVRYYDVLLNGAQGWFGSQNVGGKITPSGGGAAASDAWAMQQPVPGGSRGAGGAVESAHIIMLRTDVELGVNTTSTYKPPTGPSITNACGAFALSMMPAGISAGAGVGSLTAAQNASCPRRTANLATMQAYIADFRTWYSDFATAWAKLTRYGYSAASLTAVENTTAAATASAEVSQTPTLSKTGSTTGTRSPTLSPTPTLTPTLSSGSSPSGTPLVSPSPSVTPAASSASLTASSPAGTTAATTMPSPTPTASGSSSAASASASASPTLVPAANSTAGASTATTASSTPTPASATATAASVPGAILFANVANTAFADPGIVGILADAIASALRAPNGAALPSVTVQRITDVATGAALFRAPGVLRALQASAAAAAPAPGSAGVRVDFTVAGVSAGALQSSLSAGGGASAVSFASAVVAAAQTLAQASGSTTLTAAFGAASALVVAAALPSPAATATGAATAASSSANTLVWAIVGVLVALTASGFALIIGYRFLKRSHTAAADAGKSASAPRVIGAVRAAAHAFEMINPAGGNAQHLPHAHAPAAPRLEIRRPFGADPPQPYLEPLPRVVTQPNRPSRFVVQQPAGL